MTTAMWLQRHRTAGRLLSRIPPVRRWISARVWSEALAQPSFKAALDAGLADLAAGRTVPFEPFRHKAPRP